ncbi:ubiquitin-related domain-containing protein [Dioszegia hungarica]|uniref:Ubiquitin-related domain-containing protein n=1 Tax=Dioszegia hungarica TaxID=4972 RepID=A0AA38H830_9TREE|nr:ubiquitin-related domain-containing protein [Dioszegia hungarica]KAI9636212.1 ubiquitin-related domain-containing protein [Dioszegia hungarica]
MSSEASTSHPLAPPLTAGPAQTMSQATTTAVPASAPVVGSEAPAQAPPKTHTDAEIGSITPPVPKCHLRVLIISGQSHVFSFEPEITVGRMKEIVWSSWPSEWTSPSAPPSPSFLRVLYSGRILQDDSTLSSNNLATALLPTNPTVLHISVRSFSLRGDEGDPKQKGFLHPTTSRTSRRNEEQASSGGCKCVIM